MNKYNLLIKAGKLLFHQKGFYRTSLADIAEKANVNIGIIFHYFKTKEALGIAVLKEMEKEYRVFFRRLDANIDSKACLTLFLQFCMKDLRSIIDYGCQLGGLCQELAKQDGLLANQTAKILYDLLLWCEIQFHSLGFKEKASDLALNLVSNLQEAHLLAHIFKDSELLKQQVGDIQAWLDQLILGYSDLERDVV